MKIISLQPDPRILEVLGQIELKGWQVLAELTDNSIDGILSQDQSDEENIIDILLENLSILSMLNEELKNGVV